MHGEYKEPGGKLIQVDFTVANDQIVNVRVSGDFFLYPEEALEPIVAAVEGSPIALTQPDRAALVHAVLGLDDEWLGASPEGLAIAIDRALAAGESA